MQRRHFRCNEQLADLRECAAAGLTLSLTRPCRLPCWSWSGAAGATACAACDPGVTMVTHSRQLPRELAMQAPAAAGRPARAQDLVLATRTCPGWFAVLLRLNGCRRRLAANRVSHTHRIASRLKHFRSVSVPFRGSAWLLTLSSLASQVLWLTICLLEYVMRLFHGCDIVQSAVQAHSAPRAVPLAPPALYLG